MTDPPPAAQRLTTLDFMRGVAVMGILLMNIVGFAWPDIALISPRVPLGPHGAGDEAVFLAEFMVVDGKLRGLFSLLFGASMVLLVERAEAAGQDGPGLQRRRLGWLAAFGLAHYFLLWWGDILFLYAVCGLFALSFVDWPARRLVALALPLYALGSLWLGVLTITDAWPWLTGDTAPQALSGAATERRYLAEATREMQAHLGTWRGRVAYQITEQWQIPLNTVIGNALETLPLMLLGMAMLRSGLLRGEWPHRRTRAWALAGIVAGLAATAPLAVWLALAGFPLGLTHFISVAVAMPARLAMTVGYAALLVLLAQRFAAGRGGQRIVAAGRMAFSNYLGTSLVMAALFHGWGLGLYGRFTRVELLGFVVLGWALMLGWSKPWLVHFRQGPLEWLWRCLVHQRREPIRRLANATDSH